MSIEIFYKSKPASVNEQTLTINKRHYVKTTGITKWYAPDDHECTIMNTFWDIAKLGFAAIVNGYELCSFNNRAAILLKSVSITSTTYSVHLIIKYPDGVEVDLGGMDFGRYFSTTLNNNNIPYLSWYLAACPEDNVIWPVFRAPLESQAGSGAISVDEWKAMRPLFTVGDLPTWYGVGAYPAKVGMGDNTEPLQALQTFDYNRFTAGIFDMPNPYDPVMGSSVEGGGGSWNNSESAMAITATPSKGIANSGFTQLYMPTTAQLNSLHDYLWNEDVATYLRKFFDNTGDAIMSLKIMPASSNTSESVLKYGAIGSGVTLNKCSQQYSIVNFNTTIKEYFGSCLDYEPYTKVQLLLPYYGQVSIPPEWLFRYGTFYVTYKTEMATGDCCILLYNRYNNQSYIRATYYCNISTDVPVTSGDKGVAQLTNMLMGVVGAAASVGVIAATGGAGAGAVAGAAGAEGAAASAVKAGNIIGIGGQLVDSVVGQKSTISCGNGPSGTMKHGGVNVPYLLITRPNIVVPEGYNKLEGYATNYANTLGNIHGYTTVESIHLEDINCTESEKAEIEALLKGGVIL